MAGLRLRNLIFLSSLNVVDVLSLILSPKSPSETPSEIPAETQASTASADFTNDPKAPINLPAWFSTCNQVYLDLGSNIGVQVRKLFQPANYPEAKVEQLFKESFGTPEKRLAVLKEKPGNICALGFEANPGNAKRLGEVEDILKEDGNFQSHFYTSAVWDETGKMYYDCGIPGHGSARFGCYGGRVIGDIVSEASNDQNGDEGKVEEPKAIIELKQKKHLISAVPVVELSGVVRELKAAGKVVDLAKMDIEGAEWNVGNIGFVIFCHRGISRRWSSKMNFINITRHG